MKSGHAARLRTALAKAPAAAAAAPAENGPAVSAVLAAPAAAGQSDQGAPPVATCAEATALQKQLHDKLMQQDMLATCWAGCSTAARSKQSGFSIIFFASFYTADYTAKNRCIALYIGHALRHGPP